jgi:hypothetical protein
MWRPVLSRSDDQKTAPDVCYYRSGVSDVDSIQTVPVGLRIIAGQASATPSSPQAATVARWHCQSWGSSDAVGGPWSAAISGCAVGNFVGFDIFFPSCWNGTDLDNGGHPSHMAYPVIQAGQLVCPTTHPEVLARVSCHYAINISMRDADRDSLTSRGWRIVADSYDIGPDMARGATLHGDWFNASRPEAMKTWVDGCLRDGLDCHDGNFGNGSLLSAPVEGAQTVPEVIDGRRGPRDAGHR